MTNPSDPEVPDLDQTNQNFKRIEQAGYEIQESGQQLVRFGKAGQEQVQFLSKEIPKYAVVAQQYPSLQASYDSFKEWNTLVAKKSQEAVTNVVAGANMLSGSLCRKFCSYSREYPDIELYFGRISATGT
jgi:hypothetical protein